MFLKNIMTIRLQVILAFTKFIFIEALVKANSRTILKKLEKIFGLTGLPKSLVVDNAKYFDSNYFNNMINKMGIILKYISPHHPSSNACERANRTIRTLISRSEERR